MELFHLGFEFKNGIKVKNRISLAPMTNLQSNDDGTINNQEINWLAKRAQGGFGIIMTCCTHVSVDGQGWPNEFAIYDDKFMPGLIKLAQILKEHKCLNIVQLFHAGSRSPSRITGKQPISASEFVLDIPYFEKPREMKVEEIKVVINDFANATERAYKAGFDGIELHAANGYLLSQFLSKQTNLRKDDYGGSLEKRAKFLREILYACRNKVPDSFLIGVRINPEGTLKSTGLDLDENIQLVKWIIEDKADFIDFSEINLFEPIKKYPSLILPAISYFRKEISDFPIFVSGGIRTIQDANKAMEIGATFINLGTIAIGNSDWPHQSLKADYKPILPPYTLDYLNKNENINNNFISVLQKLNILNNIKN